MGLICPTVTAYTDEDYKDQMELVTSFSRSIHIDLMDGHFAKPISVTLKETWWPKNVEATVHLMYEKLLPSLPHLIALSPSLVIIHAECSDDILTFFDHLKDHNIRTGLALLQTTQVADKTKLIEHADHVMIFSGSLGNFGGKADMQQLSKIAQVHAINPTAEIGWDGGVSLETVTQLSEAGVDILFVGGAIHRANNPQNAYQALVHKAGY